MGLHRLGVAALFLSSAVRAFLPDDQTVTTTLTRFHYTCPCDQSSSVGFDAPLKSVSFESLFGDAFSTNLTAENTALPTTADLFTTSTLSASYDTTSIVTAASSVTSDPPVVTIGDPFSITVDYDGDITKRGTFTLGLSGGYAVLVSSPSKSVAFILTSTGTIAVYGE